MPRGCSLVALWKICDSIELCLTEAPFFSHQHVGGAVEQATRIQYKRDGESWRGARLLETVNRQ